MKCDFFLSATVLTALPPAIASAVTVQNRVIWTLFHGDMTRRWLPRRSATATRTVSPIR
jgi:hypothetical protein